MTTIETTAEIGEVRTLTVQLPTSVEPGKHRVVVTIADKADDGKGPFQFAPHMEGLIDPTFTFRREDLFGDDGR